MTASYTLYVFYKDNENKKMEHFPDTFSFSEKVLADKEAKDQLKVVLAREGSDCRGIYFGV
ncbi:MULTISPECIES: hypothetical protein [unclassified Paenibacillus]|uniref:hypothetical protein n=1 Tax=unclassified Paenibacillus TaxID=185978 RepID=UPI001AEB4C62|nr:MULTISPECIES: hypothetical protein [unclassified Paenibacillus]MBP1157737.1 hypothetical protein [Paenibacillus sp. PvP091]MBP1171527.1 hypothetical protein [Paenibacillus sp. PvR098]MBP2442555.1 hypothetical protein [Paenibacillus sp. PvP052]